MMAGPSDCMECRIQQAHTAMDMGALYPSLAPLPQSVIGNATRHKEKAYGRVLKTRVSEVWRQTVLRDSPRVTDGSPPQGRRAAFVNYLYDDLTRNLFTPAPYLRSFSADSAYYLFRIRTQDQIRISFRHRNPDPTECPKHNTETGGAHCAQGDIWAAKLICISHAQSRHHWHIHSSQSSAVISRGTASRNTSRWHFS
jgi:hypothetical protein